MPTELGQVVAIKAWAQAVSLSDDGQQRLVHLAFKADTAIVGRVIVNDSQLGALEAP
jgi:hypothetical protein